MILPRDLATETEKAIFYRTELPESSPLPCNDERCLAGKLWRKTRPESVRSRPAIGVDSTSMDGRGDRRAQAQLAQFSGGLPPMDPCLVECFQAS